MHAEAFAEEVASQLPALHLLMSLGWQYLTPAEALALRGGKEKNVILTGVLEPWLREHNHFTVRGKRHPFSDSAIREAIEELQKLPHASLISNNEAVYDLLTTAKSLTQTIDGDRKSFDLHFIDWHHPERNVYHVSEEFSVEQVGASSTRRPDLVLFVNGIPLVVIECKRPALTSDKEKAVDQAISQHLRNQGEAEIPHLFAYGQLLLALSVGDALYGTVGTPRKFWAHWREEQDVEPDVHAAINRDIDAATLDRLYGWREDGWRARQHFASLGERLPTAQDRLIFALLRPARLLDLAFGFVVYDDGMKKIARYQQYFAIKATLDRVAHKNAQGTRTGGVIWHTTGSGKSLTMVMLAKALALHPSIPNPRVVMVTDRVDLDIQLYKTFVACKKTVVKADDGAHLVRLVSGKLQKGDKRADLITSVINKFESAARLKIKDEGSETFVLVDESHRSQYGSLHAKMAQVFPRACYVGFTGTPLTRAEKSTVHKFGDFIHKYPMRQAVDDGAVVPLLYEGRVIDQEVDKAQLERWFERTTKNLNDEQRADLKRKLSRSDAVTATDQRLKEIAYNVALHYQQNFQGRGFKAQLAAASKATGLKYRRYLEEEGIQTELIISPPDTREGHDAVDEDPPEIQVFWKKMMGRYGSEEAYVREILNSFSKEDGVEILVVVDKLLTGFDEPRNTVLYIDKPLKEHTLLQAIARVNRLREGKDFGYIIDYRGVLGELNEAMTLYDALAEFEAEDVEGTVIDVSEEIRKLPQLHSDVWAVFAGVSNLKDIEDLQRHLEPEDRRDRFYEALTAFASCLRVALGSVHFYQVVPEPQIQKYKDDLRAFHHLRAAVRLRYAESVDFAEYEEKVRKLMDEHVKATGTSVITELVNIFDVEKFDAEVARLETPAARADTILNRMKRTITERMAEDPALFKRFSELIEETILAYRQGRIDQLEYWKRAEKALQELRDGQGEGHPPILRRYRDAGAYYGVVREPLAVYGLNSEQIAEVAIKQEEIIEAGKVTDWQGNLDAQNAIKGALTEQLYDLEGRTGTRFDLDRMDAMIEQLLETAKARSRRR